MAKDFPKLIMANKPQIQDAQRTQKQQTTTKPPHLDILYLNCRKPKTKKKIWEKKKNPYLLTGKKIRIIVISQQNPCKQKENEVKYLKC